MTIFCCALHWFCGHWFAFEKILRTGFKKICISDGSPVPDDRSDIFGEPPTGCLISWFRFLVEKFCIPIVFVKWKFCHFEKWAVDCVISELIGTTISFCFKFKTIFLAHWQLKWMLIHAIAKNASILSIRVHPRMPLYRCALVPWF